MYIALAPWGLLSALWSTLLAPRQREPLPGLHRELELDPVCEKEKAKAFCFCLHPAVQISTARGHASGREAGTDVPGHKPEPGVCLLVSIRLPETARAHATGSQHACI